MKKLGEIKRILRENKKLLEEKFNIKEIGIFGSYISGNTNEQSDVDLLVSFFDDDKISLLDFIKIESYLSDLLGVKVDLVEKSTLKPRIGTNILKQVEYL